MDIEFEVHEDTTIYCHACSHNATTRVIFTGLNGEGGSLSIPLCNECKDATLISTNRSIANEREDSGRELARQDIARFLSMRRLELAGMWERAKLDCRPGRAKRLRLLELFLSDLNDELLSKNVGKRLQSYFDVTEEEWSEYEA